MDPLPLHAEMSATPSQVARAVLLYGVWTAADPQVAALLERARELGISLPGLPVPVLEPGLVQPDLDAEGDQEVRIRVPQ